MGNEAQAHAKLIQLSCNHRATMMNDGDVDEQQR